MRLGTTALAFLAAAGAFAPPVDAAAEVFRKWRTPEGSIYIGENPPNGSELVGTIELPASSAGETPSHEAFSRAAEDGRELMRRRSELREAARDRELARDLHEREVVERVSAPVVVERFIPIRRHRHHDDPRLGIGPSPLPRVVRPDTRWREHPRPSFRPVPRKPFSRSFE